MKNHFLLILFLLVLTISKAQTTQVLGIVKNSETGEYIHGAIISDSGRTDYTYSNRNGYYNLGLNQGVHTLLVTASGYVQKSFVLSVYRTEELNVQLDPSFAYDLDTLSNKQISTRDYRSGYVAPLVSQVENMPSLLSEPDPMKFMQLLPGVSGGIEGLAGMYVRGGNSDQNLITMDGLPIYGNGHAFGFLSNFNPDQVRDMQFYRGVTPARYGGRAGSALDISMNEGNDFAWKGSFWADLLTLKLNADGPLSENGKTTGSFGLRRSWIDAFLPHSGDSFTYYNLYDLNAKVVFHPGKNDKLSLWCYNGRDKFATKSMINTRDSNNRVVDIDFNYKLQWANTLAGVNYSKRFNPRHYGNFLLGMSRYAYKENFIIDLGIFNDTGSDFARYDSKQKTAITDFVFKGDLEYHLNSNNYLRYGLEITRHGFTPTVIDFNLKTAGRTVDTIYGKANMTGAIETAVYGELEKRTDRGLKMNLGLRLWQFTADGKTYVRPEPRIFISQLLQGEKALKMSFGISNQGVNQLSSVSGNLPADVWYPSAKVIKPQQCIQGTVGYFQPLKNGIEFSMEGYYKRFNNINDLKTNYEGELEKNYWELNVAQGKGTAYGMETMVMKKQGKFNGLASYTFAVSNRTIPEINFGNKYPFRWDRRHKFALQGVYFVKPYFKLNFAIVVMSGNAVSVPTGKYVAADGSFVFDYSEKNNFRMPWYKRVDIGFSKQIRPFSESPYLRYWGVNIYNVFGFYNPLFVSMQKDDKGNFNAVGTSFFPFIPSAFYKWEF